MRLKAELLARPIALAILRHELDELGEHFAIEPVDLVVLLRHGMGHLGVVMGETRRAIRAAFRGPLPPSAGCR